MPGRSFPRWRYSLDQLQRCCASSPCGATVRLLHVTWKSIRSSTPWVSDAASCSASGVMDLLGVPVGPCLWIVNGRAVGYDTPLREGDELEVALMACGG